MQGGSETMLFSLKNSGFAICGWDTMENSGFAICGMSPRMCWLAICRLTEKICVRTFDIKSVFYIQEYDLDDLRYCTRLLFRKLKRWAWLCPPRRAARAAWSSWRRTARRETRPGPLSSGTSASHPRIILLNALMYANSCSLKGSQQGVTMKGRLSWLTNSAFVHEPKCVGRGGSCGIPANEYSCAQEPK
jgi:hypothetical protein